MLSNSKRNLQLAAIAVTAMMVFAFTAGSALAAPTTVSSGQSVDLYAGQTTLVGTVTVEEVGTDLVVTYETMAGWVLTETHLAVGEIPTNRGGNPQIGQFPYSATHDPAVTTYTYVIPLAGLPADEFDVAAHAVVQSATVIASSPFYATTVTSFDQGTQKDGDAIKAVRSDPTNGLEFETGQVESNFVSLGFGGEIVLAFDTPFVNGPGDDLRVIEDTWGSGAYPDETAAVYVSQDGTTWYYLGEATNKNDLNSDNTVSSFDLDVVGLESAKYVKIVDTSDPADFTGSGSRGPDADGYDLNAVEALHDVIELGDEYETAWADGMDGERINDRGRGSWATYFTFVRSD